MTTLLRRSAQSAVAAGVVALTLLVGAAQPAAAAAPSSNSGSVTFGLQPAQAKKTDQRAYYSFGVTPGATVSDHIAIVNYSPKALRLQVYATDAKVATDGGIAFDAASEKAVDAGTWVSVAGQHGTRAVTIPARHHSGAPGLVILPLDVVVPAGAAPGDHVAAIVASLVALGRDAAGTPVRLDQRVVERAYIRVSGTLKPRLRVEHLRVSYSQPLNPFGSVDATVRYTVHNTGNLLLSAKQGVSVSGLFGSTAHAPKLPDLVGMLPGAKVSFSTVVKNVHPGMRLTATVTLHPSPAIEGSVDGTLATVRASTSGWAWVFTSIVLVLLLIIGFFLWWRYWPYGGSDDDEDDDAEAAALSGGSR